MQMMYAKKRTEQMSIQQVGQEVVLYDERTHKAFCLNAVAAAVWQACDGTRTPAEVAVASTLTLGLPVTEDAVLLALKDFLRDGLLEAGTVPELPAAVTRRAMIAKLGVRAAIMLPVVAALVTPRKAHGATVPYSGCANCIN